MSTYYVNLMVSVFQKMNPKLLSGLGFVLFYLAKSGEICDPGENAEESHDRAAEI